MKPLPAPNVPGNTEAERFENAVRKIFSVSIKDVLKEEAKQKRRKKNGCAVDRRARLIYGCRRRSG